MTLTAAQVRSIHLAAGVPPEVIPEASDDTYKPCESTWLLHDFHPWFFRVLEAFDIRDFAAESGDCDDDTDLFAVLAKVCHRRTPEGKGTALPIGRFNFLREPHQPPGPLQQKHALAWAITSDRGLIFPEPQQLYQSPMLTSAQIRSCSRCSD